MNQGLYPGNGPGPRSFVDPVNRFSLTIPPGWLVDTSGQQGTKAIFFHPQGEEHFRPNINVVVNPLSPFTPEEFITLGRLQLKQLSGSSRLGIDEPAEKPEGA